MSPVGALLALLVAAEVGGGAGGTASRECPEACMCVWRAGKHTALCRGAHLTTLPTPLEPNTQILELADNQLATIERQAFANLGVINLHQLNLSACHLHTIHSDAFHSLDLLVLLDLSHNKLETIDARWFEPTPKLQHLRLDGNHIARLQDRTFFTLTHLRNLLLNECDIAEVEPEAFVGLESLQRLELAGNKLQVLSVVSVSPLRSLATLEVARNSWQCGCVLAALNDWLHDHHVSWDEAPTCTAPPYLTARAWPRAHELACPAGGAPLAPPEDVQLVCSVRGAVRWTSGAHVAIRSDARTTTVNISSAALTDADVVIDVNIKSKIANTNTTDAN